MTSGMLVIDHLEDNPLILGNPWLNLDYASISHQRKQVILRKPDVPQYIINSFMEKPKKLVEPELCVMGEVLLDSNPTRQTDLLSTKQVVRLVKRDQLDDAFLMLINEDTSIQEVFSSDDPILANVHFLAISMNLS
jgi:hypothetical protein